MAGLALTLTQSLALILAGLVVFTGGFFAAHSIGAGWTGAIATYRPGPGGIAVQPGLLPRLQRARLGRGLLFQSLGWNALAAAVMVLACLTAAIVAVVHPRASPRSARMHPRRSLCTFPSQE